jgi:TonB-dependent starch-binding outer membrane protein SusC
MSTHRLVSVLVLVSAAACTSRQSRGIQPYEPPPPAVTDGYGEKSKESAGGTAQSYTRDKDDTRQVTRVEELIEARLSGVVVTRTADGGYSVRVRGGASSFMANEEPLYVIDGVPFQVQDGRGLSFLNPADVSRIDLLKNPSETAIYGVRGANGVIVITTRKPRG